MTAATNSTNTGENTPETETATLPGPSGYSQEPLGLGASSLISDRDPGGGCRGSTLSRAVQTGWDLLISICLDSQPD